MKTYWDEAFQIYRREKQAAALRKSVEPAPNAAQPGPEEPGVRVTRRGMLKVATGTAIVGEAAALGYSAVQGDALGSLSRLLTPASPVAAEAQKHPITRELISSKADSGYQYTRAP